MSADISHLGGLAVAEPLDLPNYKAAQEFRLPPKGKYLVRAPEAFPQTAFGQTKAGFLSAQVDPTIVGGEFDGLTIKFTKVSGKTWHDNKTGQAVSQLGRYAKAAGVNRVVSGEPQDQADAVTETAGALYHVLLDWRAYNKNNGFSLEGMDNFPQNPDGTYQPWIDDPTDVNAEGFPVRLRANAYISRFLGA